jgi:RNA polymerase sigma factor (sigma-70 family)
MAVHPQPQVEPEQEKRLLAQARRGDRSALDALVEPWRRPLFGYIYRMVTHRDDAEDLLQDVLVRVLESLPSFRGESRFKTWLFGIATHVCLDHLRRKKRWRVETQLDSEKAAHEAPQKIEELRATMAQPDFVFETREHIAFCFACLGDGRCRRKSRQRCCCGRCWASPRTKRRESSPSQNRFSATDCRRREKR